MDGLIAARLIGLAVGAILLRGTRAAGISRTGRSAISAHASSPSRTINPKLPTDFLQSAGALSVGVSAMLSFAPTLADNDHRDGDDRLGCGASLSNSMAGSGTD